MIYQRTADVVIIGSGIAALTAAERLSENFNVILITKSFINNSNSVLAQGGIAVAIGESDDWKNHYKDTMIAGNFHNFEEAVKTLVIKGPRHINRMIELGMNFDRDSNGNLHLGKEGAHNQRRILHAGGDATGKAFISFLLKRVSEKVTIFENCMAVDFLIQHGTCIGIKVKDEIDENYFIYAAHTVLATGGCGGLYPFTSNNVTITGDGIAMAYRAGADLVDLEFMQFHPTMLYVNGQAKGLISEAVRGEGGVLRTENGSRLMENVHELKDLAPRDIVSREIYKMMQIGKKVFLDISNIDCFTTRFPTVSALCQVNGIDLSKGLLPVVPGAHFLMGGVKTTIKGETSIPYLYAIGEVACSGVHGANRLASNSLLEGIVFAHELADHIETIPKRYPLTRINEAFSFIKTDYLPQPSEIREMMMTYVGIVREHSGLMTAKNWFEKYYSISCKSIPIQLRKEEISKVNMLTVGWLITSSALMRTESRGGHYRDDYAAPDERYFKKRIVRNIMREQKTEFNENFS